MTKRTREYMFVKKAVRTMCSFTRANGNVKIVVDYGRLTINMSAPRMIVAKAGFNFVE